MIDVLCKGCGKLLLKVTILHGAIKCTRCKMIFEYNIYNNRSYTNLYDPKETDAIINDKKSVVN